jgi:hypothetical protein
VLNGGSRNGKERDLSDFKVMKSRVYTTGFLVGMR